MQQIYDIYLNFNTYAYDFFDWNKSDNILHIKKIPIYKISKQDFKNIITSNIKINNAIAKSIKGKTEYINKKSKNDLCTLFSDSENIIALLFDNSGKSFKRSYLYIDEELDVLDEISNLPETKIEYTIVNKVKIINKTRKQINDETFIKKELNKIEDDKLNYIYYECFGYQKKDKNKIFEIIEKLDNSNELYKKVLDILKLTSTNKNKMI